MKTITLKNNPLTITEAIVWLQDGRCLGIKPGDNTSYMVLQNPERGPQRLIWPNAEETMMIEQITGEWYPVIADHRELSKKAP